MIEKMVINMALKSMKDNFLSLSDEEKQKEFCKLLDQNQELKEKLNKYENPKDMTLMMMWCTEKVKDENVELKKQLEETVDEYIEFQEKAISEQLKSRSDVENYHERLNDKEREQKEFIKYLEKRYKDVTSVIGSYGSNTDMLYSKKDMLEEILQKYKEIIRGKEND